MMNRTQNGHVCKLHRETLSDKIAKLRKRGILSLAMPERRTCPGNGPSSSETWLRFDMIPDMDIDNNHDVPVTVVTSQLVSHSDDDDIDLDADNAPNAPGSNDSSIPLATRDKPGSTDCDGINELTSYACDGMDRLSGSPCVIAQESPMDCPMRSVHEFKCLCKIEEGVHGTVYKATDKKTGELVAVKWLKLARKADFSITNLNEVKALLKARHDNVVSLRSIILHSEKVYLVMEYMDHDLTNLMKNTDRPFSIEQVKSLMMQLLRGVGHLHDISLIHRDLKPTNLLINQDGVLKIGDLGLAREYGFPGQQYTPLVVTLWYRCPELLLGAKSYGSPIDMWSVGCIFSEMLSRKPLFRGRTEVAQITEIFKILGNPNERIWPGVSDLPVMKKCEFVRQPFNKLRHVIFKLSDSGFILLNRLLAYNPERRVTATEALSSSYFQEEPVPELPSIQSNKMFSASAFDEAIVRET